MVWCSVYCTVRSFGCLAFVAHSFDHTSYRYPQPHTRIGIGIDIDIKININIDINININIDIDIDITMSTDWLHGSHEQITSQSPNRRLGVAPAPDALLLLPDRTLLPAKRIPGVAMRMRFFLAPSVWSSFACAALALASSLAVISASIFSWSSCSFLRFINRSLYDCLMLKNIGPNLASHSGSTAVTQRMYSFEVMISSWYLDHKHTHSEANDQMQSSNNDSGRQRKLQIDGNNKKGEC